MFRFLKHTELVNKVNRLIWTNFWYIQKQSLFREHLQSIPYAIHLYFPLYLCMPEFIDSHLVDRSGTKVLPFIIAEPFKSLQQKRDTRAHTNTRESEAESWFMWLRCPPPVVLYTRVISSRCTVLGMPRFGRRDKRCYGHVRFQMYSFASEKIIRFVIASAIYRFLLWRLRSWATFNWVGIYLDYNLSHHIQCVRVQCYTWCCKCVQYVVFQRKSQSQNRTFLPGKKFYKVYFAIERWSGL